MLKAINIDYNIGEASLLKNISLEFRENEFTVIMGQNGAGKTTLLKILAGSIRPSNGEVLISGIKIESIDKFELAKKRAVLSQHYDITFPITVEDIVMMGRYPYFRDQPSKLDLEIVNMSLEMMGVENFRQRDYNTLSGGEAQKVQMARVLSQIWQEDSDVHRILFLDEPVSSLDIHYQHIILKLLKEYSARNILVVGIVHDINLAFEYADRVVFMKNGSVVKNYMTGSQQIEPDVIREVFDVEIGIIKNPFSGKALFIVK